MPGAVYAIVSHSTGGLLVDAALHAAQTNFNLNARFITERCKAHVGPASAVSGSRLATAELVAAAAISPVTATSGPWICLLIELVLALDGVEDIPPCPITLSVALRSVLSDLVPRYTNAHWGNAIDSTHIPTVDLGDGRPGVAPAHWTMLSRAISAGLTVARCRTGCHRAAM